MPQEDKSLVQCTVQLSHQDSWARVVFSLGDAFTGGKLVEPTPQFLLGIEGQDTLTKEYGLSNWVAGLTSGGLYTFRALKLPRRKVHLHRLDGKLRSSGVQALANGAAVGIAKLCDRPPPTLELAGWRIDCSIESPGKRGSDMAHDEDWAGAASENRGDARQVLVALAFKALVEGGVKDPDVLLWNSLASGDLEPLRAALESGANPNATDGEVLIRHGGSLTRPPVSDTFAAAALSHILSPNTPPEESNPKTEPVSTPTPAGA